MTGFTTKSPSHLIDFRPASDPDTVPVSTIFTFTSEHLFGNDLLCVNHAPSAAMTGFTTKSPSQLIDLRPASAPDSIPVSTIFTFTCDHPLDYQSK